MTLLNTITTAEVIDFSPAYKGEGNFQGCVIVEQIFSNGAKVQLEIDGEHSEQDIQAYATAAYWNE